MDFLFYLFNTILYVRIALWLIILEPSIIMFNHIFNFVHMSCELCALHEIDRCFVDMPKSKRPKDWSGKVASSTQSAPQPTPPPQATQLHQSTLSLQPTLNLQPSQSIQTSGPTLSPQHR